MAESSEQHSAEDIVPIQNFMRRFSHVDNHQELNRLSLEAATATAAAKEPSLWEKFLNLFKRAEQPPVLEPTRFDFILLPLLNAKNWLVSHPKTTMAIFVVFLAIAVDRLNSRFHALVCWCMEDKACVVGFVLQRMKFMILCF